MSFNGYIADLISDDEYKKIVGRGYTGGDVIAVTIISTGADTTINTMYDIGSRSVRVVQVTGRQNNTLSIRYAIIAGA